MRRAACCACRRPLALLVCAGLLGALVPLAHAETRPFVDSSVEARSPPYRPELLVARERYDAVNQQQALYVRVLEDATVLGMPIFKTTVGRITLQGATIVNVLFRGTELQGTDPEGSAAFTYGLPGVSYDAPGRGLEGTDPRLAVPAPGTGQDALRFSPGGTTLDFFFSTASDVDDLRLVVGFNNPPGSASFSIELFVASKCPVTCGPQGWPPGNVRGVVVGSIEPSAVPDDGVFGGVTELGNVRLLVRELDLVEPSLDFGQVVAGALTPLLTVTVDNFAGGVDLDHDNGADQNGPFGRVDGLPFPANVDLGAVRFSATHLVGPGPELPASAVLRPLAPLAVPVGSRSATGVQLLVPAGQVPGLYQGTLRAFEDENGDGVDNDATHAEIPVRVLVIGQVDGGGADGGPADAGVVDAGVVDGGASDGGELLDGGASDGGELLDGGPVDGGLDGGGPDGGAPDGGGPDGGGPDGGAPDGGAHDGGDGGSPDGGAVPDGGGADAGLPDAGGPSDAGLGDGFLRGGACSCNTSTGSAAFTWSIVFALFALYTTMRRARSKARQRDRASPGERRRWFGGLLALLAAGGLCADATDAVAQSVSAPDVQLFRPTTPEGGYLTVDGTTILSAGQLAAGLVFSYARDPLLRFRAGSRVGDAVSHLGGGDAGFSVGLGGPLQLGLAFPFALQSGLRPDHSALSGLVVGDLRLSPRLRLYERTGLRLAVVPEVTVPTGDSHNYSGEAGVSFAPRVNLELLFGRVRTAFSLGYRLREAVRVANLLYDDELYYRAALAVDLHPWATAIGELYGATSAIKPFKNEVENPLEVLAGVRFALPAGLSLLVGAGAGVLPGYGAPTFRAFLGVGFVSPAPSARPPPPEVKPPEVKPPEVKPPEVKPPEVKPPEVKPPEVKPPEVKPPPADRDGDGVPDAEDLCPDEPGPKEQKGCPDSDGDGLPNHLDRCPYLAEDKDGFADEDGCPDPDNDFDGIPDAEDPRPLEPETPAALRRPPAPPELKETVRFVQKRMLIREKIHFHPASTELHVDASAVLDRVAAVVKEHGIIKLRIDGHVAPLAAHGKSALVRLSEQLAERVRKELQKRGVDAERLATYGHGAVRPILPPDAPEAAQANRRVEFVVVEQ